MIVQADITHFYDKDGVEFVVPKEIYLKDAFPEIYWEDNTLTRVRPRMEQILLIGEFLHAVAFRKVSYHPIEELRNK